MQLTGAGGSKKADRKVRLFVGWMMFPSCSIYLQCFSAGAGLTEGENHEDIPRKAKRP